MSTTWHKSYSFQRIFKDRQERTGHCKSVMLCRPLNPSSGQTDFRDRLTHVQLLFTWNLSPLQSSKFSFEYLLLPPRSALEIVRPGVTPKASSRTSTPAYSPTASLLRWRRGMGNTLERHPFSGLVHSA
ncbi:hypothetical protein CMV_028112, partial [Castanea mollissima]